LKNELTFYKILSITCDNATNNDKMIRQLSHLLENFPGAANQTRCFTHILNLVVKSILKQFDPPKKKAQDLLQNDGTNDGANKRLDEPEDIDVEEELGPEDLNSQYDNKENDNMDGWIDEQVELSHVEVDELEASVLPVRLVLTKVSLLFHH